MRRTAMTVLLTSTLIGSMFAITPSATANRFNDECRYWRWDGRPGYVQTELEKLADCIAKKFGIDPGMFRLVISHESGWTPSARNPSSGACSLMQFYPCSKFPALLREAKEARPKLKPYGPTRWSKPRQALAAGARLVKRAGWDPWCGFTTYC